MTLEGTITKLQGPIIQTFWEFDPKTLLDASQILDRRKDDEGFRDGSFWTADLAVYTFEDPTVFLYLARLEDNPVFTFENIEDKMEQLVRKRNITLSEQEQARVMESPTTLKVDTSKLDLTPYNHEFCYFVVNTANYQTLNAEQRLFAERIYGEGEKFGENMRLLNKNGVENVRVYVLNPEYVKKMCEKNPSVARIGRLGAFPRSNFRAVGRNVGDGTMYLCGHIDPQETGRKLRNEQLQLPKAIQIVLAHPDATRQYIDAAQASTLREAMRLYEQHSFDGIISIKDSLLQSFLQLDPSSIQHAHEITTSRRDAVDIRNEWFWTADGVIYLQEGNDFAVYLTRGHNNLILNGDTIEEATKQLISARDFVVPITAARDIVSSQDALRVPYTEMELVENNHEFSYMRLPISSGRMLDGVALEIAKRILGEGQEFSKNREFMLENNISDVEFFVLNPTYLERKINPDICLMRVCRLGMIEEGSTFKAIGRGVDSPYVHVRGRLRSPELPREDIDSTVVHALSVMSRDPLQTAQHLNQALYGRIKESIET